MTSGTASARPEAAPLTRCYEAATIAATSVGLILGTVGGYMAPERVRPRGETYATPVKLG